MGDPTEAAAGGGLGAARTGTPSGSLLERAAERGRIAAALEAARAGGGALLAIEGEAGIGKTRLLALARELAGERFEVLSARGAELEQRLAYGVCTQLFERRLAAMSPGERERALAGAAVHAQAALGLGQGSESPNVELHGLYWLVANLAGQRPLLLLVDDLHWGDEPSLRWLHYVAGRLDGLRALVVVATRPSDRPLVVALLADSGARALRPAGLSEAAVTGLVADRLGDDPHPAFVAACRDATLGNPFLIVELLAALVADGVAPTLEAAGGLREVRPRSIARSMLARLARLGPSATALAQCVAVLEECSLAEAGALADLDPGLAAVAADQLAREGILRPGRPLGFVHPIVAATIVDEVPGAELAEYHARAARLLADAGADAERVALHLLAAEPAGDSWAVTQLRVAAARALARGAADVAGALLRRALAEPPPDAERAAVLAELGLAAARAGEPSAADRLREALELEPDPRERAALALVLGRVLAIPGDMRSALEVLERAIDELGEDDRELSLRLESEAITFSRYAPATVASAQRRLAALRAVQGTSSGERLILAQLAIESALVGDSAQRSRDVAQRALGDGALLSEESSDSPARYLALHALVTADAVADAQLDLDRSLADARRRGSALGGASASMFRSHALLVGARWRRRPRRRPARSSWASSCSCGEWSPTWRPSSSRPSSSAMSWRRPSASWRGRSWPRGSGTPRGPTSCSAPAGTCTWSAESTRRPSMICCAVAGTCGRFASRTRRSARGARARRWRTPRSGVATRGASSPTRSWISPVATGRRARSASRCERGP